MRYDEFLNSKETQRVYLFSGQDEFIIESSVNLMLKKLDEAMREFNSVKLYAPTLDRVIAECEQLPMMAEKRFVFVYDFAAFKNAEGKSATEYVKTLPESTCLVFVEKGEVEQKALYKAIEHTGAVVIMDKLSPHRAAAWVAGFAKKQSCEMTTALADELVALTDGSMLAIMAAVTRVCDYAGKRPITESDIDTCMKKTAEYDRIKAMNSFLAGDFAKGMDHVQTKLREKGAAMGMLMSFGGKICDLLLARQYLLTMNEAKAAQLLGGHPYAAKMTVRDAQRFSVEKLENAAVIFADADYDVKCGRLDDETALITALTSVFSN